jgi:hypothetical protein
MKKITVKQITTKSQIKDFVRLPSYLYKNHPFYVPQFTSDDYALFNPNKNLHLKTCLTAGFLVYLDNKCVGRVFAIIQPHDEVKYHEQRLRFTCFDVIDDQACFDALFNELLLWGQQQDCQKVFGPLGFNDTDREGLLIDGFETMGTFVSNYNYPYYQNLLENYGFKKDTDWFQYRITKGVDQKQELKIRNVAEKMLKRLNLKVVDTKKMSAKQILKTWGYQIFDLIDLAYAPLYATVPISREAVDDLIDKFAVIMQRELFLIITDQNDQVAGFCFCFPNISKVLNKTKGKVNLFNFMKYLKAFKNYDVIDWGLIGVHPKYEGLGLNAIMMTQLEPVLFAPHIKYIETNLLLENNRDIISMISHLNFKQYRTNRAFILEIDKKLNSK